MSLVDQSIGPFHVESSGNLGGSWQAELWMKCRDTALRLARVASCEDRGERIFRVQDAATRCALAHFRGGDIVTKERGWN